ncbi:MAG: 16S rRNA (guanine(527)-N(7))-methyltransferase RsmG [Bacteroidota bacterium]
MDSPEIILKYFPKITTHQKEQINKLGPLYEEWNARINVISRKDIEHFYERHVLHSLAIANFISFNQGSRVLDVGTGGGFPGIPLAILFPEVHFTLVDSIGKKIKIVEAVSEELGLTNVKAINGRVELLNDKFDFVVSRATASLSDLVKWTLQSIKKQGGNGIIALKGGDLKEELKGFKKVKTEALSNYFKETFFETKQIVFWPVI